MSRCEWSSTKLSTGSQAGVLSLSNLEIVRISGIKQHHFKSVP